MTTIELSDDETEVLYLLLQRILKGRVKESLVKCRYCDSDIKIVSLGVGWQPRELDGSLHRCKQYKPKDKD